MAEFDIRGKNCLITGASTGIGLATVKELLKNGLGKVCIADINERNGEEAVKALTNQFGKGKVLFVKTDVSNTAELENAFKTCLASFKTLDIVINNAGIMNDGKWELQIEINVNAVVRGTLLAFQYMGRDKGGNGGVVVNFASILGLAPLAGCPIYVGTKHAVVGLTRSWGLPFHYNRTGIKVIAMCPGVTDTGLISEAHGRQLNTEEGLEAHRELSALPKQPPEHIAISMLAIIRKGEPGSIWVAEGGLPVYEVDIPERQNMRKN